MDSPQYSNDADASNEEYVCELLKQRLERMGVFVEMDKCEDPFSPYDYRILVNNRFTTAVEVRCRNVTSERIEKWGNVILSQEKLNNLKDMFYSVSPVTQRGIWKKPVLFLFFCTMDHTVYSLDMRSLLRNWNNIETAPESMMKDDHGATDSETKGYLIPINIMEKWK